MRDVNKVMTFTMQQMTPEVPTIIYILPRRMTQKYYFFLHVDDKKKWGRYIYFFFAIKLFSP